MQRVTLSPSATQALEQGSKIEAIKIVRKEQNIGLKEAKDLVEHFLEQNPLINERLQTSASGSLGLVMLVALVITVIAFFIMRSAAP